VTRCCKQEVVDLVRIRLTRRGAKGSPAYRVVVAHKPCPRDGRFIEILGHYIPTQNPEVLELKADRVAHWLSKGAVPSGTCKSLFRRSGILKQMSGNSADAAPAAEASEDTSEE
jgi:small subunit ribosomal protein S16